MEIKKQIRKINLITGLVLSLGFVFIVVCPTVYASDYGDFIRGMAKHILTGGLKVISDTIAGEGVFGSLFETCTQDFQTYEATETAYKLMQGVGAVLALAVCISHLFQSLDRGQDPVESIFKSLIEILMTFLIINNIAEIMGALTSAGVFIMESFTGSYTDNTAATLDTFISTIGNGATDGGITWFAGCFVKLAFPWILAWLVDIAAKFVIIQLVVEIAIRRMFAPLAIVDIYQEGMRSPGARYFKKYLAAFLKLAVASFIGIIVPTLIANAGAVAGSDLESSFNYCFTVIAINFAAIGIILKAGEYANDIVGV